MGKNYFRIDNFPMNDVHFLALSFNKLKNKIDNAHMLLS